MTVGYPDYARLSQAGGYELYSAVNSSPPENFPLFRGYVGSWPYVNLQTRIAASADFAQFGMRYYDDDTFTNLVGFRFANRGGANEATTQYANLSPWLDFRYQSISGLAMPVQSVSLYGSTAPANQFGLASMENPILQSNAHIGASTLSTFIPGPIQPGNAQLQFLTGAASWYVNVQAYSYTLNAYETLFQINNVQYPNKQFVLEVPMIDSPMALQVNNGDAASQNFIFSWVSKL